MKKIDQIISSRVVLLGNTRIFQPIPHIVREDVDPFLLLHHAGPLFQEAGGRPVLDVGPHPHRGFEPVTFVFQGSVRHRDSAGNDSVIHQGGVQWMTAGKGIIHSERLDKEFIKNGGALEIIQLWVNLASDNKMKPAEYQGFQADQIPVFTGNDKKSRVHVIAGTFNGLTGPVESISGITAYTIEMEAGSSLSLPVKNGMASILYSLSGKLEVENQSWGKNQLAVLGLENDGFVFSALEKSRLLFVSGKPLGEEVNSYGPFVMNTQSQIMEAVRDYQAGRMGYLVESE